MAEPYRIPIFLGCRRASLTVIAASLPSDGLILSNGYRILLKSLYSAQLPTIPHWENPLHLQSLESQDALAAVQRWCDDIRTKEQPDYSSSLITADLNRICKLAPTERQTGQNQGYAMCMEIEGLDVLITGHQHRSVASELNGVTIIQPGLTGSNWVRSLSPLLKNMENGA